MDQTHAVATGVLDVKREGLVDRRGRASPVEDFANVSDFAQLVLVALEPHKLLRDALRRQRLAPEIDAVDGPLDLPLRVSRIDFLDDHRSQPIHVATRRALGLRRGCKGPRRAKGVSQ